jgi:hypothetical protein
MVINKTADCIRKVINISEPKNFFKFDKPSYDKKQILQSLEITSPKLLALINNIKKLDEYDFKKYGKKFKHIIYSDIRSSTHGIKLIASVLKAFDMNNIYDSNFRIKINKDKNNNNFALLSSVNIYDKPFPIRLRKEILTIFNQRPDNINGDNIRFLLLDQGFKEGIDVFDVKYVHLFDDLITPGDEKQAIGRGTRFCGQKGLEFHPELGWPLHVFKYKLKINKDKYEEEDAFLLFLKESKIDIHKLYFSAELENICRFGAVDYEINKAIHEYGNEANMEEGEQEEPKVESFKIRDIYETLDNPYNNEFKLLKKAYNNFGGALKGMIKKKTKRFINIKKIKQIPKELPNKLNFIDMRLYIRRYFKKYKWTDITFANNCIDNDNQKQKENKNRFIELTNTQKFISEYFTANNSYKGLLLWHSVGTGKTCTAIATASNTFEKQGYTILWITRHTLKPEIWKNMYNQICSYTIKEKIEINKEEIPVNPDKPLSYLNNQWITPISYKQFSNLIKKQNEFYNQLVKKNGLEDPLKKTLIIIDEAHKLFADDVPSIEKPDINTLKKAIYHSYNYSKKDSCKLLLMTATPYTNNPMQLFKLINLLKEDNYFTEDFDEFKDLYLDDFYKFKKDNSRIFLDNISGYISYLNREKDVRQFAYPVLYTNEVNMSDNNNNQTNTILDLIPIFKDEFNEYLNIDIKETKELISNLETLTKKTSSSSKQTDIINQEQALDQCLHKNKTKKNDDKKEELKKIISSLKTKLKEIEKQKQKELKEIEKQKQKELKEIEKQKQKELKKLKK